MTLGNAASLAHVHCMADTEADPSRDDTAAEAEGREARNPADGFTLLEA